jgi:transposase
MNDIKYIGIDVHRATSVFAVRNNEGRIVTEAIVETGEAEISNFLKGQSGTLCVTFEEGTYANWLYDVIKPHVSKLIVSDPRKNKRDGSKTDRIDARKLAELLRSNSLKAVYHGENGTRTLKELARSYINIQQDSTRVKNRVKAIFRGRGIACKGQAVYGTKKRQEWLQKLKDRGARLRAQRLLEELELLVRLRLEARKDMVQESRKHRGYKILRGIPGVGSVRAALILAFVMTPHRLTRSKRKPLPRGLNRSHNGVLKDIFKSAALTAASRGPFKKVFDERIQKGIPPNLALLTMARKISSIALALWKKGEPFDSQRYALGEQTR